MSKSQELNLDEKKTVKTMKERLKELGYDVKLRHCYEVLAKIDGYKNRHHVPKDNPQLTEKMLHNFVKKTKTNEVDDKSDFNIAIERSEVDGMGDMLVFTTNNKKSADILDALVEGSNVTENDIEVNGFHYQGWLSMNVFDFPILGDKLEKLANSDDNIDSKFNNLMSLLGESALVNAMDVVKLTDKQKEDVMKEFVKWKTM